MRVKSFRRLLHFIAVLMCFMSIESWRLSGDTSRRSAAEKRFQFAS